MILVGCAEILPGRESAITCPFGIVLRRVTGAGRQAGTNDDPRGLAAFAKMDAMAPRRSPGEEPAHDVLAAEAFAMPGADPRLHVEPAHDVLAAEAFAMPGADPRLHVEPAHDVLAAEAFAMPGADPRLHVEPAHDVLAAEEFAMPAADPGLHHGPVVLPEDPTGIAEAHDVLAAEEFAMPAGWPGHHLPGADASTRTAAQRLVLAAAAFAAYLVLHARRRR